MFAAKSRLRKERKPMLADSFISPRPWIYQSSTTSRGNSREPLFRTACTRPAGTFARTTRPKNGSRSRATISSSCRRQFLIRQRPSFHKPDDRVPEQVRVVAVVEPERELVQVRRKILLGELVIAADHRAVEQAPNRLHGVRVNVSANPLI